MTRLTDIQDIWNYLELMCKRCRNICRKFEKDSWSRTIDITDNLISVRKWGNEQTGRHTKNWLKLLYKHPKNVSWKFEKDSSSRTGDIIDTLILNNFRYLVCLSVCSLPHFVTEIHLSMIFLVLDKLSFYNFLRIIRGCFHISYK